jgi:hypothetical protein
MLHLSTEFCVKRTHLQRRDVTIRKIARVENDRLETAVRSACGGMDGTDGYEIFRGPSVGIVQVLLPHHVSFSNDLVPQLQL